MTNKGEIVLRELVKAQCGSGAETKRQLPVSNAIPASSSALGKEYSVAEAFSNLYDTLVTIATQSEIGWRVKFDGALTLEVYEGQDLSNQVQFSTDFDSLANGEFTDSSEAYANTVYVAGKGTGSDRDIYEGEQEIEGATPEGLDRFEAFDNQSSMTSESEYEAEAYSMLTQYGQTIQISGNGLAKCPYIFKEQYDIGDTITLAFSGKSAKAQILSVTEHWTWGHYGIEFSFGKPQNDLSRQLQLMLKQIQKASNKTTTTSSVKYYTIPTDTTMPKADVIYDRIGFTGDVGNGATFQLYYDSEKTGAKCYHIYFKQLGGTGKLTLTTGVTGKANLSLNAGTYVAIVYVDGEGNVTTEGATPTTTIEANNTQPVESGAVNTALSTKVDTSSIVDTVQSGNMNPVTSNAVDGAVKQRLRCINNISRQDFGYSQNQVVDFVTFVNLIIDTYSITSNESVLITFQWSTANNFVLQTGNVNIDTSGHNLLIFKPVKITSSSNWQLYTALCLSGEYKREYKIDVRKNGTSDPIVIETTNIALPSAPSSDGTYNLRCIVASGITTYSWGGLDFPVASLTYIAEKQYSAVTEETIIKEVGQSNYNILPKINNVPSGWHIEYICSWLGGTSGNNRIQVWVNNIQCGEASTYTPNAGFLNSVSTRFKQSDITLEPVLSYSLSGINIKVKLINGSTNGVAYLRSLTITAFLVKD